MEDFMNVLRRYRHIRVGGRWKETSGKTKENPKMEEYI